MAIKSIDILNVLIFQRQWQIDNSNCKNSVINKNSLLNDGFHLEFSDGINVIIGENGVGKTSLLKMIYAATQWSNTQINTGKNRDLLHYFSANIIDASDLKNYGCKEGYC